MKTRKILALALALVMVFSLSVSAMAFYTDEELKAFGLDGYTPNEIANDKVSRDVALESYVLMKNNGVLPIAKSGKIALFGNGATGTIKGGRVEADNTEADTVEVPVCYAGDETVTSVRVQLSSQLPIVNVTSTYETFAYNPDNGKVVVSHPDGVSGVLFTVTLDISDESLKAGKYPVDIEIIEVTDDTGAVISAAAADGEVDLTVAVILGDVNQDGVVDNRDLIMIARYLVDLVSFSYDQKILADFNEDGTVNNTDLVLISRFLVA